DFHPCASDPKAPRSGPLKIQLDGTSSSWQSLHITSKGYVLRRSIELTGANRTLCQRALCVSLTPSRLSPIVVEGPEKTLSM
ncbi:MAG TPA: hypothetical protein VLA52_15780, partial [Thermohalobaculum sp.]|nr:hypothetical protein [Thermohalobaculum sp.]